MTQVEFPKAFHGPWSWEGLPLSIRIQNKCDFFSGCQNCKLLGLRFWSAQGSGRLRWRLTRCPAGFLERDMTKEGEEVVQGDTIWTDRLKYRNSRDKSCLTGQVANKRKGPMFFKTPVHPLLQPEHQLTLPDFQAFVRVREWPALSGHEFFQLFLQTKSQSLSWRE